MFVKPWLCRQRCTVTLNPASRAGVSVLRDQAALRPCRLERQAFAQDDQVAVVLEITQDQNRVSIQLS